MTMVSVSTASHFTPAALSTIQSVHTAVMRWAAALVPGSTLLMWKVDAVGCDREFMSYTLRRKGTRASRRCWPAVILTAVNPLWAGRQQHDTAGTAMFHYMKRRSHPCCAEVDEANRANTHQPSAGAGRGRRVGSNSMNSQYACPAKAPTAPYCPASSTASSSPAHRTAKCRLTSSGSA